MSAKPLTCYCQGYCPNHEPNGTCVTRVGGYCFAHVQEVLDEVTRRFEPEYSYGCSAADETGLMTCRGSLSVHDRPTDISCCYSSNMCNKLLELNHVPAPPNHYEGYTIMGVYHTPIELYFLIGGLIGISVLLLIVIGILGRRIWRKSVGSMENMVHDFENNDFEGSEDSTCKTYLESRDAANSFRDLSLVSSGSGAGLPLLTQQTIAKQITLVQKIGRGRFGEVYLGNWREGTVAVKMFGASEEASWCREQDVYNSSLMCHENIACFIAADVHESRAQFWLITTYYENGSLFDFLSRHTVDPIGMYHLAHSAANGLAHLHFEPFGTLGKKAIAHRDLKSKNILVKRDGTCAISDFGIAVMYDDKSNQMDWPRSSSRTATVRYMAPEVLDDTIEKIHIDPYKRADVYSLGLVLWEIARRCDINGVFEDYEVPFYNAVSLDPTTEEMRKVVCTDGYRPEIPPWWQTNEALSTMAKIMKECWAPNPRARLEALRVKKSISTHRDEADWKKPLI